MIFLISLLFSPFNDWKIAECSLSTGKSFTPFSFTSLVIICPATTKVSLFARAISFLALIASIVGKRPANPTIAFKTISTSLKVAIFTNPSFP